MAQQFDTSNDSQGSEKNKTGNAPVLSKEDNEETGTGQDGAKKPTPEEKKVLEIIEKNYGGIFREFGIKVSDISKGVNEIGSKAESSEKKAKDADEKAKEAIDKSDKAVDQIQESKLRVTETLGIFVSLFTFISVEFQLFNKVESWERITGFTLILSGILILFNLLLHLLMKPGAKQAPESFKNSFSKKSFSEKVEITFDRIGDNFLLALSTDLKNLVFIVLLIICILLIHFGVNLVTKNPSSLSNENTEERTIENNNFFNFERESRRSKRYPTN